MRPAPWSRSSEALRPVRPWRCPTAGRTSRRRPVVAPACHGSPGTPARRRQQSARYEQRTAWGRSACRPRDRRVRPRGRPPVPAAVRADPRESPVGRALPRSASVRARLLRRQGRDQRVVLVDCTELGRPARGAEVVEELGVGLGVVLPLLGDVVLVEDRLDRADRLTGAAVDTLVWVYVEHPLALVDAVDRTLLDTRQVLQIDARLRDGVCHELCPPVGDRYGRACVVSSIALPAPAHAPSLGRGGAPRENVPECWRTPMTTGPAARANGPGVDRIGPSDVGRRVVVRYHLPSEGTATDVLGELVGWTHGRLRVRRSDGQVVDVPEADVVAAKPVPPRPVVRREVRALEAAAALGWQALETERIGGWLLRYAGGFTRRANSCLPLSDPGIPLAVAVAEVERWYAGRSANPSFQVIVPLGRALEEHLDALGWPASQEGPDGTALPTFIFRLPPTTPLPWRPTNGSVSLSITPPATAARA